MTDPAHSRRVEGLDALRGLAILLVMLRHAWPELFGGAGIVGVVLFFTLSGYLITRVLLSDLHAFGRVRYGRFYRNRAFRLLPALVLLLVGFVIVEGLLRVRGNSSEVPISIVVALTYTMNVPGIPHGSESLTHLWTLANEEQFYIIWPIVLAVGLRRGRLLLSVGILAALVVVSLVVSAIVFQENIGRLYTLPSTWSIAMVIGACLHLLRERIRWRAPAGLGLAFGVLALGALLLLSFFPDATSNPVFLLGGGVFVGLCSVVLISLAEKVPVVPGILRPLRALGLISYAAYLWNYPMALWTQVLLPETWEVASIVLTIALATLSWWLVEYPVARYRAKLDRNNKARARKVDSA